MVLHTNVAGAISKARSLPTAVSPGHAGSFVGVLLATGVKPCTVIGRALPVDEAKVQVA